MQSLILEIVQSDSKQYTVKLSKNDVPQNISGWTLKFTVKNNFNDADIDAVISKSILLPNDGNSENGVCSFSLSSADTNLPINEYFYDLKFIHNDERQTFARGQLLIIPSILGE